MRTARSMVVVGILLALAACATGAEGGRATSSASTPSFTEDLTLAPTTGSGSPSASGSQTVELEGEVSSGVEAGCLILTTDSGVFTLVGRTSGIRVGARVRVRGAEAPDVATVCQQGTVFRVDALA